MMMTIMHNTVHTNNILAALFVPLILVNVLQIFGTASQLIPIFHRSLDFIHCINSLEFLDFLLYKVLVQLSCLAWYSLMCILSFFTGNYQCSFLLPCCPALLSNCLLRCVLWAKKVMMMMMMITTTLCIPQVRQHHSKL